MNSGLHSLRAVITTGLAVWMTVAVINNATDPGTNIHFLANMLSMEQLLADAVLGNGLEWRSWDREYARIVLAVVAVVQAIVVVLLWRAGFLYGRLGLSASITGNAIVARRAANLALCAFTGLWLIFMVGGFWFGYWIKQGPVQQVHMMLLLIGIGYGIIVNIDDK